MKIFVVFACMLLSLLFVPDAMRDVRGQDGAASISVGGRRMLIDLTGVPDGQYLLIRRGNTFTLLPSDVLTPGTPLPVPSPIPVPPAPRPDELTARAREIRDAANLVQGDTQRAGTARMLAGLWREIANDVRNSKLPTHGDAMLAVRGRTDVLLTERQVLINWAPVREALTEQWTEVLQRGGPVTEYADLLLEASGGLDASAVEIVSEQGAL